MEKIFLLINPEHTQKIAKRLVKDIFTQFLRSKNCKVLFAKQGSYNFHASENCKTFPWSCAMRNKQSIVIAIKGNLGSGKTTFIQGLAKELEIKERIVSPTFIIMKKYQIFNNKYQERYPYLYHLDLYRLDNIKDIRFLNLDKIIALPNIIVIEWPEKIKEMLPQNTIFVEFIDTLKYMKFSKNLRKIKIDYKSVKRET